MDDSAKQFKRKKSEWVHPVRGSASNGASTLFKLATTTGVLFSLATLFYIWSVFGDTTINLTLKNNPDLERGLVGHWSFDGKDLINNVADSSGQGNDGRLVGTFASATSSASVQGKLGQALSFNGSDDYVVIPSSSDFNFGTGAFTYSMWVKKNASATRYDLLSTKSGSFQDATLFINSDNTIKLFTRDTTGTVTKTVTSNSTPSSSTWFHVVATRDSAGVLHMYINGTTDGTPVTGATQDLSTGTGFDIGENQSVASQLDGTLDDVRIYNRALSADEVERLYNLGH